MKTLISIFLVINMFPAYLFSQTSIIKFEKTSSFFPNDDEINRENIVWGYINVPENWDKPEVKPIKIAIAILKSTSKQIDSNPVVYLEGGPGAGGIEGICGWLKHPLRKNSDIILVDFRGTGFSIPKLCPDLGKRFLEILAKNQNSNQDEQQKAIAAAACKLDLINRDIDINSYNSKSISKDLDAIKKALKYNNWNVYGISYGTYIAQVYANDFPQDIKSLILDSPIPDISQYYNKNTTNYANSLKKVFAACKNDSNCNKQYPDLENKYYKTIEKLDRNPITVSVDKKIIPSGKFTYNAEDFKISIQQSLYQKKLICVLPLLITEFNKGNKTTLSALVSAFSGALTNLDYGMYYCVSCNEVIPYNSILEFNKDALKYKNLKGGLSFYKSDFVVCDKWNLETSKQHDSLDNLHKLSTLTAPVLVFSGEFDPITPVANGQITVEKFKHSFLVKAPISGHAPSFSKIGSKIIAEFISNPSQHPNVEEFQSDIKVNFATDITISGGISNFANSLNSFDFLFFSPLIIAIMILLISFFNLSYLLIKNKKYTKPDKLIRSLIVFTSLLGLCTIIVLILAINNTINQNFYILAFGLPKQYSYLFIFQWFFVVLTIMSLLYFVIKIKSISNTSVIFTILFSLILVCVYFQYWGFLL